MKKPHQVVISPNVDFYLNRKNVLDLAAAGDAWALSVDLGLDNPRAQFYPTENELARHSKQLIAISATIDRFQVVDLEVRVWPPKYLVLNKKNVGEEVIEPASSQWRAVYYAEDYSPVNQYEKSADELAWQRIKAIAP